MHHEPSDQTTNSLGFTEFDRLEFLTIDGSYIVRLISKLSEHLTQCHPGNPELFHDLVPELNRLQKRLPAKQVRRDTYEFLQRIVATAIELRKHWASFEPYLEPRLGPAKRPRKQRSAVIDAMSRREAREAREEIVEALAG